MKLFQTLNKDQLDGLAGISFDLAKASFILAVVPAPSISDNPVSGLLKVFLGLFWGLACTYIALVILRLKGQSQ